MPTSEAEGVGRQRDPLTLIVPILKDPRFVFVTFYVVNVTYAITFPGFGRSLSQLLVTLFTCFLVDGFFNFLFRKKAMIFPMSGIVSSMGLFLLTDAYGVFYYFLAAVFAMTSKHLLRLGERHLFNPNNFGITMVLLAFPDSVSSLTARWGNDFFWTALVFSYGMLLAERANRHVVALSYYGFFAFFSLIRSWLTHVSWISLFAPLTGPGIQIFIFFMITDPKTSPAKRKNQALFGACIGALDNLFRYLEIRQSHIFTLPCITLAFALYFYFFPEEGVPSPWKTREIRL